MTFIDAGAPIAAHAAIKQNVHGVGANDIADVADISTHAAIATNIHGTGAGNDVVGDDEVTALAALFPSLTVAQFQANAATGTFTTPERLNNNNTSSDAYADTVNEYAQVLFPHPVFIREFRQFGHTGNTPNGKWKIQIKQDGVWVDNTIDISNIYGETWSSWISLTSPVYTQGLRLVATVLDTGFNVSYIGELEVRG